MGAGFLAGQRLTAAALNTAIDRYQPLYKELALDHGTNNNTTLINLNDLVFTVEAGVSYRIDGGYYYLGNATGDIKFGWDAPAGSTLEFSLIGPHPGSLAGAGTSGDPEFFMLEATTFPTVGLSLGASTTRIAARPGGTLRVGATGGTARVMFAQDTSNATLTYVKAGSWASLDPVD